MCEETKLLKSHLQIIENIFLPEFVLYRHRITCGHAFAVTYNAQHLILSCMHLFGVRGGLSGQISAKDLSNSVYNYILHDCTTDEILFEGNSPYYLPNTEAVNLNERYPFASNDLVAFPVPYNISIESLDFSFKNAQVGEIAWIKCIPQYVIGATLKKFKIEITEVTDDYFLFKDLDDCIHYRISGAPIISNEGYVLGMCVGEQGFNDVNQRGIANPSLGIMKHLNDLSHFMN